MESDIFSVIEEALSWAGYKIYDDDKDSIVVHHQNGESDYRIRVTEIAL